MQPSTQSARDNFATCVAMMVVSAAFVGLRFFSCISLRQMPGGPDWLCLVALILFFVYNIIIINFIFNTSAYGAFDFATADLVEFRNLLQVGFPVEILFGTSLSIVKLSILWFYNTLFNVKPSLRWGIMGTVVVCVMWFVASILLIVLQCDPPSAFWNNLLSPEHCLSNTRMLLGFEVTNLLVDVAILAIPAIAIRDLQLATVKKASVIGIFLMGGFVCVTSIVRLTAIWRPPNVEANFDFPMTMIWSTIQVGMAIICACLPKLGPLLALLVRPFGYIYSYTDRAGRMAKGTAVKVSRNLPPGTKTCLGFGS